MNSVKKAAVIGAGMMGAEIALSFSLSGIDVILKDINMDLSSAGINRIHGILSKWEKNEKITWDESQNVIQRISAKDDYSDFEDVEIVIEAALENFEIKKKVFVELDEVCKNKDCIFASNTSSIPITRLAACITRPAQFIGMHFFSPASVMKLVEIIPGLDTSEITVSKTKEISSLIGKEAIIAPDRAGFIVNRLLFAFFNEAWRMVDEGAACPEDIDKAIKLGLGHPVGIFQMQDLVGLDNALSVTETLYNEYGERYKTSAILKRKVEANHIGRKVKRGWYDYK